MVGPAMLSVIRTSPATRVRTWEEEADRVRTVGPSRRRSPPSYRADDRKSDYAAEGNARDRRSTRAMCAVGTPTESVANRTPDPRWHKPRGTAVATG
jgi:hypothetical protein